MQSRKTFTRRIFVTTGAAALVPIPAIAQSRGWTTIFDGKSLDGWSNVGKIDVHLADGIAEARTEKGNGHLVWKEQLGDFELRAELFVSEDANSGIFVRFPDKEKPSSKDGYEFNIFDTRPDPSFGTGAIVDTAKAGVALKAGGKWNVIEITCKGPELTFKLNGQTTVDKFKDTRSATGYISIQFGVGLVKLRKVEIRKI